MKKAFAFLLALCLVFSLAACGASKTEEGIWQGKIDLKAVAGDELGEMADYLQSADVDVILELKADKSFDLKMDASAMLPVLKDAMRAYMEDMLASMGMSVEDFEAAYGQSLDAMIDAAVQEMNTDDLNQNISGTYTEDNGKLVLTPASGSVVNGAWSGDSLTLQEDGIGDITFARK